MDLQITKQDGSNYTLSDYNIKVSDIVIESMETNDKYTELDGTHGRHNLDSTFTKRKISVPVFFIAKNHVDYSIQRDLLFELIQSDKPFYIREMRKPHKKQYDFKDTLASDYQPVDKYGQPIYQGSEDDFVSAKRYLVKLVNVLVLEQKGFKGNVSLEFETTKLPFAESIGTSQQLHKDKTLNDLWSADMEINFDAPDMTQYTFNNLKTDSVFYYGKVPITQFNQYSVVTIILSQDTDNLSWSLSNGGTMTIKGLKLKRGDVIIYDGIRVKKNGVTITEYCNLVQPKFSYGWNKFQFNQTIASISFDMRFYYK